MHDRLSRRRGSRAFTSLTTSSRPQWGGAAHPHHDRGGPVRMPSGMAHYVAVDAAHPHHARGGPVRVPNGTIQLLPEDLLLATKAVWAKARIERKVKGVCLSTQGHLG